MSRPTRVLPLVLALSLALTACSITAPEAAPHPAEVEGVETTFDRSELTGVAQGLMMENCDITVTVPSGFTAEGSMVIVTGDRDAGSMGFIASPTRPTSSIDLNADGLLEYHVHARDSAWDTNDGGSFLTVNGADAWIVTGTKTTSYEGHRWIAFVSIITPACDITAQLNAAVDDVETQNSLIAMVKTITAS